MVERSSEAREPDKYYPEAIRADDKMKDLFDTGVNLAAVALNALRGVNKPGRNLDLSVELMTSSALVLASTYPVYGDEHVSDERSPILRSAEYWRQQMTQEAERRGLVQERPAQAPGKRWPRRRK